MGILDCRQGHLEDIQFSQRASDRRLEAGCLWCAAEAAPIGGLLQKGGV